MTENTKDLENVHPLLMKLFVKLDNNDKSNINRLYFDTCTKFDLKIDSELSSFLNCDVSDPEYCVSEYYENMKKLTNDFISNILNDYRQTSFIDIKKIGETFAEISNQDQDAMYSILVET